MNCSITCIDVFKTIEKLHMQKKSWIDIENICSELDIKDEGSIIACLSLLDIDGFIDIRGKYYSKLQVRYKEEGPPLCFICHSSSIGKIIPVELNIGGYPRALPICERCIEEQQCPVCHGEFAGNGKITRRSGGTTSTEVCFGCNGTGKYHY